MAKKRERLQHLFPSMPTLMSWMEGDFLCYFSYLKKKIVLLDKKIVGNFSAFVL